MSDWPLIATRLALYVDLGLLFGVPLFGLYALRGGERVELLSFRRLVFSLAVVGAGLSLLGFVLTAASMAGTDIGSVDRRTVTMLLSETAVGWAFAAREIALALALLFCMLIPRRTVSFLGFASASGAVAVGTLAWSGHGAASEGAAGFVHLGSDIVHLLAASAWLGALAMLVVLVMLRQKLTAGGGRTAHRALSGFATVGSILVGLLVLTGIVNGLYLVGIENIRSLGSSLYGQLLIAKLILFAAMLGIAANNRFRLTTSLEIDLAQGDPVGALARLRRSLVVETGLALVILALVAWFGTLEPPLSGR